MTARPFGLAEVARWVEAHFWRKAVHRSTSSGATHAGLPVVLDAGGKLDASLIDDADIDHGAVGGLSDDDHAQYLLAAGSRALTGDWDIGSGRKISATTIAARDANGLSVQDDGGNVGVFVADGGKVAVGGTNATHTLTVSAASNPAVAIQGPAIDFSANQQTAFGADADEATSFTLANNGTGGTWFKSFGKAAASGIGAYFTSYSENDLTTFSSFEFVAKKHNGAGALTAHGSTARILSILNNTTNLVNVYGNGNVYFAADVSALTFTDRTKGFEGDALAELAGVKAKGGKLDHTTLPAFARSADGEGRDLGAMISMLTVAVQQLAAEVDALKGGKATPPV